MSNVDVTAILREREGIGETPEERTNYRLTYVADAIGYLADRGIHSDIDESLFSLALKLAARGLSLPKTDPYRYMYLRNARKVANRVNDSLKAQYASVTYGHWPPTGEVWGMTTDTFIQSLYNARKSRERHARKYESLQAAARLIGH